MNFRVSSALGVLTASVICVVLSSCATHQWAPPAGKSSSDFEAQKAQCSIFARNGGQGFSASGTQAFVAGAAAGNAVGNAVKAQQDFNDCMAANGWTVADQTPERIAAQKKTVDGIKVVVEKRRACVAAVRDQPQFASILPHLNDNSNGKFSITQMADTTYPTPEEAPLMGAYADAAAKCRDQAVVELGPIALPAFVQAIKDSSVLIDQSTVTLIKREITWGEWANRVRGYSDDLNNKLKSIRM